MDETAFETLEALGTHLANKILTEFQPLTGVGYSGLGRQVKITLEKPTAVPFADAPAVQIRVNGDSRQKAPSAASES